MSTRELSSSDSDRLAIDGGPKGRSRGWVPRKLFGEDELGMVRRVFEDAWKSGRDFGFQGKYEAQLTAEFCRFQGGGFADAVCTGTAAVRVALEALEIPPGSDVVVSPVTSPGSVVPAVQSGLRLSIADSAPGTLNVSLDQFEAALTADTKATILTHVGGVPIEMQPIVDMAHAKGIKVLEDCSHAHGAAWNGVNVGCFGDMAAFSTMFSKTLATGGCGGVVFTRNEELYWRARARADRGKDFRLPRDAAEDPKRFLFPAGNDNLDEISCAIGVSVLSKVPEIIERRRWLQDRLVVALDESSALTPWVAAGQGSASPFFLTVRVDESVLCVDTRTFARALQAEGVWLNPHYSEVVCEWPWIQPYLTGRGDSPNAIATRDHSFNILFHEGFTDDDVREIGDCMRKVERHYAG